MQEFIERATIESPPSFRESTVMIRIILEIVEVVLALVLYFLPAIIADRRKRHDLLILALFNALLSWTVFGWIAALYWAYLPNPPVDLEREVTRKRRTLSMRSISQSLVQRIERRAAKRDSAQR